MREYLYYLVLALLSISVGWDWRGKEGKVIGLGWLLPLNNFTAAAFYILYRFVFVSLPLHNESWMDGWASTPVAF